MARADCFYWPQVNGYKFTLMASTYHGTFSSSSSYPFRPYEAAQLGLFVTGKALSAILHLSQIEKEEDIPEIRSLHGW